MIFIFIQSSVVTMTPGGGMTLPLTRHFTSLLDWPCNVTNLVHANILSIISSLLADRSVVCNVSPYTYVIFRNMSQHVTLTPCYVTDMKHLSGNILLAVRKLFVTRTGLHPSLSSHYKCISGPERRYLEILTPQHQRNYTKQTSAVHIWARQGNIWDGV